MTPEQKERYLNAGYAYYIEYETYLPIIGIWTLTGFPATRDAIEIYRENLSYLADKRGIRDVKYIPLA